MLKRYLSRSLMVFGLALPFIGGLETTTATQDTAAAQKDAYLQDCLKKLATVKPTLEEILDPNVEWGINIDRVMERGKNARKASADKCDFSSRITLYQKHKSLGIKWAKEIAAIDEEIKKEKGNKEKVQSLKKEKARIQANIDDNKINMTSMAQSIHTATKLTKKQIYNLPDYDTWSAMPKQQDVVEQPKVQENLQPGAKRRLAIGQRPQRPQPQPEAEQPEAEQPESQEAEPQTPTNKRVRRNAMILSQPIR